MPMAACIMRKGLQKRRELEDGMGRKYSRQNNGMCESVEYLGMLL